MARDSLITLIQQTKLISCEGGTINLAGISDLTIPEGSLSSPTEIRVLLYQCNDAIYLHFEPHGTVFTPPAQLTISQACWEQSKSHPAFDIYYHDGAYQWQPASFVTWSETPQAFQVQIPHFSSYYFIRRQGPSVSQSDAHKGQSQPESGGKAATSDSRGSPANPTDRADNRIAQGSHHKEIETSN